ncbi:MAG: ATPase [Microcystis aeruginosa Ma_QC_Ch_20071001_S25]|jgi:ATP-dependent DNA helicase RecG|uniref:ATPase n=1 Tax=Microcystis aeruginosa Ma_QC_Ch_20071001_S25D TaxID=2486250 RepID=A0A552FT10_MICAE|nr:MAG: ATPase [Microcystis aeruginosa Ma_QC_Ch_20071001_S25]TRU49839.1 MAG: ATPase [Microcystis aeruginosa Ma_QC_Ch_20071001_S25D]TRU60696.1 MAG: ATPase [Microcystis aeruginosa Ma_QC_Ch_20071001_M135]
MKSPIPPRETLTVEFKSDQKKLSDRDLIEAITCLANTDGGELWLGVEDDGTATGLHPEHRHLNGLGGLVAARTSPSLTVQVETLTIENIEVARIQVPQAKGEVATTNGVYLRRRLKPDGTPECVPMMPHDRTSRASTFGLVDVSAQPVAGSTLQDFDPLERERLRQCIQTYGGDRILLELDDADLDGALGLTARQPDGSRIPTLTGLLLIGREAALRDLVPTHEFAFQVMAQQAVHFNEFRRFPLLKALDWLETNFRPYNPEEELQVGLFRVPVPKVDMSAFREAIANALIHRDYHERAAVHVRLEDESLVISNPGGLVDGVTLANLLTTEPRPRNPRLADAMKRIGLVERSGRGIDSIYRGLLRFGRPAPNYSQTDSKTVFLRLSTDAADLEFLKLVVAEENRQGKSLPIDSLIALAALHETKRLSAEELATYIQRDILQARKTLEFLNEIGLVQAHGINRSRTYTLAPTVYQAAGQKAEYTRQIGFSNLQNEQFVLNYAAQHGQIKRSDVMDLCRLTKDQASKLLQKLKQQGRLNQHGMRRATFYTKVD